MADLDGQPWRYSLLHWDDAPLKGEGRAHGTERQHCVWRTLHNLQEFSIEKKNVIWFRLSGQTHAFVSPDNKTKKESWNLVESINMICVWKNCLSYSLRCSLRHSAASFLYIVSTGRTHWKLYSYTTKKHKRRRSNGAQAEIFYMIERKGGGKREQGDFWNPSRKLPSHFSLCLFTSFFSFFKNLFLFVSTFL